MNSVALVNISARDGFIFHELNLGLFVLFLVIFDAKT